LAHSYEDRAVFDIKSLYTLNISHAGNHFRLVIAVRAPDKAAFENSPTTSIDYGRAVAATRREEQCRRAEMSRLDEKRYWG
jgi:hypothetical protein